MAAVNANLATIRVMADVMNAAETMHIRIYNSVYCRSAI